MGIDLVRKKIMESKINIYAALAIVIPVATMILAQTIFFVYKFGRLEQKVAGQNGRLARLETVQDNKKTRM